MHNRDKYPEIWAAKEAAEKELAPLLTARKKHTEAMAELESELIHLILKKNELNDEAMSDAERIGELRRTISRMAIAMGAVAASR